MSEQRERPAFDGSPISKARAYRVNATGRTRVLVPQQSVPRKVTISVIGPGAVYVSQDEKRELRDRPELYGQRELPPDVRLPVTLSPGRGMWVITQGPIVPVSVQIEYLWDQDPGESIDDYKLVQAKQDVSGYDQIADRNFNGVLCNDPWALMVDRAAHEGEPRTPKTGVV